MKKVLILISIAFATRAQSQTPDNTNPGSTTPNNVIVTPPPPVQNATIFTNPPNAPSGNPTGTGGTDMTNPNQNGSYQTNPDGKPRDNFQSNPNTTNPSTPTLQPKERGKK